MTIEASPYVVEAARRANTHTDIFAAMQTRMIAKEIRDTFKNRRLPEKVQFRLSGLIADLLIDADKLMGEP